MHIFPSMRSPAAHRDFSSSPLNTHDWSFDASIAKQSSPHSTAAIPSQSLVHDSNLGKVSLSEKNSITQLDSQAHHLFAENDYSHLETDMTNFGRKTSESSSEMTQVTSFSREHILDTSDRITLEQLQSGKTSLSPERVMLSKISQKKSQSPLPNMAARLHTRDKYRTKVGKTPHFKSEMNAEILALKKNNPEFEKADQSLAAALSQYTQTASGLKHSVHPLGSAPTNDRIINKGAVDFQKYKILTSQDNFVNELILMHDSAHSLNREHNTSDHPSRAINTLVEERAANLNTDTLSTKAMEKLIIDYVEYRMLNSALS